MGSPGSIGYGSDPSSGGENIITGSTNLTSPISIRQDRRIGIKGKAIYLVEVKSNVSIIESICMIVHTLWLLFCFLSINCR